MRIAESLDLPDDLERARAIGNLVIFAGAGVSIGPPSNLPSFEQLAREIAEQAIPWTRTYAGKLDRYLGDASRKGVKVHEAARWILGERGGRHTTLHEHLLGVFGSSERVRLITTNFDTHFTSAATKVFASDYIPHYMGPALPPGRDFHGIAQIHGSLNRPQDSLVLTDRDFAAAYLADGWASRFLVPVFEQRMVLFVGYSLSDPVMQYLIRALPQTNPWYALCHRTEASRWSAHDVVPVTFETMRGRRRYHALNIGLERWFWYAHASPVDHDREMRRIVAGGPPVDPKDDDYLRARLRTAAGRQSFWGAAQDTLWFNWALSAGYLEPLTNQDHQDPSIQGWIYWCLAYFCVGAQPPLLRWLQTRPLSINSTFASNLALHISREPQLPPRAVLRQLVALIVNRPAASSHGIDEYTWLLERLVKELCADEAFAVLDWLTRVRLMERERYLASLEEYVGTDDEATGTSSLSVRIGIQGNPGELAAYLDNHGAELAGLNAERLLRLGEERLRDAYALLDLARGNTDGIDWLSYRRTAIAPSNQDSFAEAEDVLVLIARTAIDSYAEDDQGRILSFAKENSQNPGALLRRLALYAFAKTAECNASDIIELAADQRWASDMLVRPELYLVLTSHFCRASEPVRAGFIARLRDDAWWGADFDDHAAHARFSLSQMLLRICPASDAVREFAATESVAHATWVEQDRDGFLSRVESGWSGEEPSPISAAQLVTLLTDEVVGRLRSEIDGASQHGPTYSLFGAVQQAARLSPAWGIAVLTHALQQEPRADDIAESIIWGLRDLPDDSAEKLEFLGAACKLTWTARTITTLASVVETWVRNISKPPDVALLDALDETADLIFDGSRNIAPAMGDRGWTERAINHPAGHAAQVWWSVANARDSGSGTFVLSVDDAERSRWERVLADDTFAGNFARPILGMASDRLIVGDAPWAERVLLPAFSPVGRLERAAQLWDGRLMQSRWSWPTVIGLRPYLSPFLEQSATLVPARSKQLGDWIAMLVAGREISKISTIQLLEFVAHAAPEARTAFADKLPQHVARLTPDGRIQLWKELLRPYWRSRLTNVPLALAKDEIREMIGWVVALPEVAADVLTELIRSPGEQMEHADHFIWEWKDNQEWLLSHPCEAVGLIEFIADRDSIERWNSDHAADILEKANSAGAPTSQVIVAAEALAGRGSRKAIVLVEKLKGE